MALNLPNLDDRTYDDLVAEAISLIPIYAPEWTNHNPSDPGITLIELFAYLTEMLLYRQNRITDANRWMFVQLLNGSQWVKEQIQRYGSNWEQQLNLQEELQQAILNTRDSYRAITSEDFERLAITSDSRIARAHCLPRRNLESENPLADAPSHISMIIVPHSHVHDSAPQPDENMIMSVVAELEPRRLITTKVHIVKPDYVPVGVRVKLFLNRDALPERVQNQAVLALQHFLHPVIGGAKQQGWPFGRSVYVSEIYDLLDRLPGVDYVTKVDGQDELIVNAEPGGDRYIRNESTTSNLIGIFLQPHELVTAQINHDYIQVESPI